MSADLPERVAMLTTELAEISATGTSEVKACAEGVMEDFRETSSAVFEYVHDLSLSDAENPVQEAHAFFLLIFSLVAIVMFCASTTVCVRVARDSNIAANALSIRRRYQRNMQLYLIRKQMLQMEREADRVTAGPDCSPSGSVSMSEDSGVVSSS